jgi:hypothetical protein
MQRQQYNTQDKSKLAKKINRTYTNAGSWPLSAKTALTFATLEQSVAIVPTIY